MTTGSLRQPAATTPASAEDDASKPYSQPAGEVFSSLGMARDRGLDEAQVAERREKWGFNELHEAPPIPPWKRFLAQFRELVIWILIVAAVISGIAGDWPDMFAILAIVLLNGTLGFLQEERAARALSALRKLSAPTAKVVRGGVLETIPARDLVPGDRIELEAGDNVPADARLFEVYGLRVQESALTGESVPVEKDPDATLPADTPLGDRRNMVYMSTIATAGKGRAIVTATGMKTELGRIAGLLQQARQEPTPLQRRLGELGKILVFVCLGIVTVIFALELFRGGDWLDLFLRSVSLAVAAVPEGLPAVVTMALALGLQRMVKRNVLIRRLPSVETLGSVTVICSDKTGTLTRNEMTVRVVVAGGESYRVGGTGYAPTGEFLRDEPGPAAGDGARVDPQSSPDLMRALTAGLLCNAARVAKRGDGPDSWQIVGDPTEAALVVVAMKAGLSQDPPGRLIHEIPFDSSRKAMSVVLAEGSGAVMYTKGAPEVVLRMCALEQRGGQAVPLSESRRREIMQTGSELAGQALRVLALAYREVDGATSNEFEERDMVFAGLAGMIDPPRDEVKVAISKCRGAGIRPVMITGDHPETASAIARELGLLQGDDRAVDGRAMDEMSDDSLTAQVRQISVYARVSPEHKLRVVHAWRAQGDVVAMTGDGVNDAPAVQSADIGIAMGITGTDVTKEASDMVLTDDNFTSIVNAVEEGRGIFDNIQKFIHYLLSCNAGEVLLMFFAAIVGWPAPLIAIQILWINLVTDGLPALALAMEPPERDIMNRPPRPPREHVITPRRGLLILFHGTLIATVAAVGFYLVLRRGDDSKTLDTARTVAFCIMSYSQLFFAIGCRSHYRTLPELGLFTNLHLLGAIVISGLLQLAVVTLPFFQNVFKTRAHLASEWFIVIGLSLVPVTVIEVAKLLRAALRRRGPAPQ